MNVSELIPIFTEAFNYDFMVSLGAEVLKRESANIFKVGFFLVLFFSLISVLISFGLKGSIKNKILTILFAVILSLSYTPIMSKVIDNHYWKKANLIFDIENTDNKDTNKLSKYIREQKEFDDNYVFSEESYSLYEKKMQDVYAEVSRMLDVPTEELYKSVMEEKEIFYPIEKTKEEFYQDVEKYVGNKRFIIPRESSSK